MKYWVLLLGVLTAFNMNSCSKGTDPEDSEPVGVWQTQDSTVTFAFDDTTWWRGINYGTYEIDGDEGTLFLFGLEYAAVKFSGDELTIEELIMGGETFVLSRISDTPPVFDYESSLTRKGNFLAFTSDRPTVEGGAKDDRGNIFIYTVDSNAYLDTVSYFDMEIMTTVMYDTAGTSPLEVDTMVTHDTTLIKRFIPPIRALTARPGLDAKPAWSPEGDKLAFVSDQSGYRAIWVYFLDEFASHDSSVSPNPVQLTDPGSELLDNSPTWSPDGAYIAFERVVDISFEDSLRDIFIIPSAAFGDESKVFNFTRAADADCFNPEWAPKIEQGIILFESKNSGQSEDWDVYWMDDNDSSGFNIKDKTQKFTNSNRNGHPTWSPDCQRVAYERNPPGQDDTYDIEIKSFDRASASDSTLAGTGLTDQNDQPGLNRYPTWLPNGNLIAFLRENNIWIIDLSAGIDNPSFREMLEDSHKNWDIAW